MKCEYQFKLELKLSDEYVSVNHLIEVLQQLLARFMKFLIVLNQTHKIIKLIENFAQNSFYTFKRFERIKHVVW